MITYEITVDVAPKLVETYESFMRQEHIPDVLATGCFQQASFTRSDRGRYRIRYEVGTAEMLESYLAAHAPRLRDAFAVPRGLDDHSELERADAGRPLNRTGRSDDQCPGRHSPSPPRH